MKTFKIFSVFGETCVNGTSAREYAITEIVPILEQGKAVSIDFSGVNYSSSSFINALIFNTYGYEVVKNQISYTNGNHVISSMIDKAISTLQSEID